MPRRTRRPAANDDPRRRPERASQPGGGAPGGTGSASGIPAAGWYRLSQWRTRGFWTSQRVCQLVVCGLLLLAVALAFAQTAGFSFVNLDDTDYVTGNPHVSAGLSWEGTVWALTKTQMSNWHPLTWLSLMLDCSLYDLHPGGHHVTNVLLHAATVVGLFLVLQAMTGGTGSASGTLWPSALVAALFAIHPLRAESVAWVTERKDVLSGLFFVLTLGAYVAYARRPFSLARYAAVMVCLALGLLSKAILVPVPFLLLLLDYWPLGRLAIKPRSSIAPSAARSSIAPSAARSSIAPSAARSSIAPSAARSSIAPSAGPSSTGPSAAATFSVETNARSTIAAFWRLLAEKLPLLAVVAAAVAVTIWAQQSAIGAAGPKYDLAWRLKYVPVAYVTYLGKLFCPVGLAGLYPRPSDVPLWQTVGALAILLAVTAAAAAGWRRFPYLLVGWLWFLGMSVPVIGFVQLGVVAVADRNTYLPQIGLAIAVVWGAADACRMRAEAMERARAQGGKRRAARRSSFIRQPLPAAALAAAGILAVLLAAAWRQTWFWCDSEALWIRALACTSNNSVAHTNLAAHYGTTGRPAQAVAQYLESLALDPKDRQTLTNLGGAYLALGQFDKAETFYLKALAVGPKDALTHSNLGFLLTQRGRYDEAFSHYHQALASDPDCGAAHYNLGLALYETASAAPTAAERLRRIDEAIDHYRRALSLHGENPEKVYNNLGNALKARGRLDEAARAFREAIRLRPDNAPAYFNLALVSVDQGQAVEAERQYRQAIAYNPKFTEAHWQLGRLLAAERRWDTACAHYERAIALAPGLLPARLDLAAAQLSRGDLPGAIGQWKTILRIKPDYAPAMLMLAEVLARCPDPRFRDGRTAIELASRVDKLAGGKSPEALRVLAAAQAATGQFPQAAATAQAALELAEQQHKGPLAESLKADVARYKAEQPQ